MATKKKHQGSVINTLLNKRNVPSQITAESLGQLALMLRASVPLVECFDALSKNDEYPELGRAWEEMHGRVCAGHSFSSALSACGIFPPVVVMLVKAGESSGQLSERLERAADLLRRSAQYQMQLKRAISGPLFTCAVSVLVFFLLVHFIMPRFLEMYSSLRLELPLPTQAMVALVKLLNSPFLVPLVFFIAAIVASKREQLRQAGFSLALDLPVTRGLLGTMLSARFCDVLSCIYSAGMPVNRGLRMMAETTSEHVYATLLNRAADSLEQEGDLPQVLAFFPFFPPALHGYFEVAVESGNVDAMLNSARRMLDQEVEYRLEQGLAMIEPILMVTLGVLLGLFLVAMLIPMYDLVTRL